MTDNERIARLEERVEMLVDSIKDMQDKQDRILNMLTNGFLERKIKNVFKQQIGDLFLKIILSSSGIAVLLNMLINFLSERAGR